MEAPTYPDLFFTLSGHLPQNYLGQAREDEVDSRLLRRLSQLEKLATEEVNPPKPVLPDKVKRRVWLGLKLKFWRALKKSLEGASHPDALAAVQEVEEEIQTTMGEIQALDKPKPPRRTYSKRFDPAEVKRRTNITALVGRYVRLKKRGKEHIGKCPFHDDRHPSFSVNPEKGLWCCYACGIGGDIFSFLTRLRGYSFQEAVEEVSRG